MPRPRKEPIFEIGGQWIGREGTSPFYHRFWTVPGTGRTRRRSLATTDLEDAKRKLAAIVLHGEPKTERAMLSAVLLTYCEERTDNLPSKKGARIAARTLGTFFGGTARVGQITEAEQKRFAEASVKNGHSLSYIARNLSVLSAAFRHSKLTLPVFHHGQSIKDKWSLKVAPPRKPFVPSDDELARFLSLPMPDDFWRWLIISCLTGARPEAALQLTPEQRVRDVGLLELNPEGRAQNKKFRPTVREPRALTAWLDCWESVQSVHFRAGRFKTPFKPGLNAVLAENPSESALRRPEYCSYRSVESVQTAFERLRPKAQLPKLSAYSIRHKVVTVLRQAGIHDEQISRQIGHRAPGTRITAGYGEYSPDYLRAPADALDAWWIKLQGRVSGKSLFPPVSENVVELRRA